MPAPRMLIVAGPSGGGKSSLFPIFKTEIDAFSTDLRAASLLGEAIGAGRPVWLPEPEHVALYMGFRQQAGREMERFIDDHIDRRRSFAFETTLREVTFEQARLATQNGFRVEMIFVAGGDAKDHAERVAERGVRGGHIASESALFDIYERSMNMLRRAFEENKRKNVEILAVYDNPRTPVNEQPRPSLVVEMVRGSVTQIRSTSPAWFHGTMRGTQFEFRRLQERARDNFEL
jgi:predicted ABC-type ATPase